MRVKLILPALTEAKSPFFRPIKYSLFPPLGLATLAGYLDDDDEVTLQDEHVETLDLDDEPDLVVIQVYITSARRAYQLADHYRQRGSYVALGGLHVTSLPDEAAPHADTIFLGPGEDTWPAFLADYRAGRPGRAIARRSARWSASPASAEISSSGTSTSCRTRSWSHGDAPTRATSATRKPSSRAAKAFYTQAVDDALAEIERLPGRHLYFLDDHLFGNARFASALFEGMRGMNRVWQAAGTVPSVLRSGLLEQATAAGLRSLFVGFETLSAENLREQGKLQNLHRDYDAAIRRLHDHSVMVNGSFVFGMDGDDASVFDRTVDWAIAQGIETATFHILTPYPGTALHDRMRSSGRILHDDWDLYDTRHVVYRPARLTSDELEAGYWRAYESFYRWGSIFRGARTKRSMVNAMRHVAYAGGWKKLEPFWDLVIRAKRVSALLPALESVLAGFGRERRADLRPAPSAGPIEGGVPLSVPAPVP